MCCMREFGIYMHRQAAKASGELRAKIDGWFQRRRLGEGFTQAIAVHNEAHGLQSDPGVRIMRIAVPH